LSKVVNAADGVRVVPTYARASTGGEFNDTTAPRTAPRCTSTMPKTRYTSS